MFEIEELFDLTIEGAFEGAEDFNAFAKQASPEELYSVMIEGAFESPEELEASFKKKTIRHSDWEVVLRSLPPYLVISS